MSEDDITPGAGSTNNVLLRRYEAQVSPGDGRTVDVRIVPFGKTATIADGNGGVPLGMPYREEWMPGAFGNQVNAANRVLLNFEHQEGIAGIVGHGTALRSASDGYYGTFRIHGGADGDKALMLVNEGVLGGVSLEAYPLKSVRSKDGVIQRVRGHLDKVALCRNPAFADARVLAIREEDAEEHVIDEEIVPNLMDPEVVARCQRLGIKLPQRYQAHPDETDTPADAGTSEDGTRQPIDGPTS